jgi:hypothetical protein
MQSESYRATIQSLSWMRTLRSGAIYPNQSVNSWNVSVGIQHVLGGGGDKGDIVERSTHPKPPGEAIVVGVSKVDEMVDTRWEGALGDEEKEKRTADMDQ